MNEFAMPSRPSRKVLVLSILGLAAFLAVEALLLRPAFESDATRPRPLHPTITAASTDRPQLLHMAELAAFHANVAENAGCLFLRKTQIVTKTLHDMRRLLAERSDGAEGRR